MKKLRIFAVFIIFAAIVFLISACNINTDTDEPEERIYEVKKVSLPDGFSVTGSNLSLYHDKQNAETFAHFVISDADADETKLYSISLFDNSSEYTPLPIGTVMYVRHYSGEYTYISKELYCQGVFSNML